MRGETDAEVGVHDGPRLKTFLAAGTLDQAESLDGIRQVIGQSHIAFVDVFMGTRAR